MKKTTKRFLAGIAAACMMATAIPFSMSASADEVTTTSAATVLESHLNDASYMETLLVSAQRYARMHLSADGMDENAITITYPQVAYFLTGTDALTVTPVTSKSMASTWHFFAFNDGQVCAEFNLYYDGTNIGATLTEISGERQERLQELFDSGNDYAFVYYDDTSFFYDGTKLIGTIGDTVYDDVVVTGDIALAPLDTISASDYVLTAENYCDALPLANGEHISDSSTTASSFTIAVDARRGDLNGDGVVDLIDAVSLQKVLCGLIQVTDAQIATADLNEDGNLTDVDAEAMMRILLCYDD
jgi:hypothetical protein